MAKKFTLGKGLGALIEESVTTNNAEEQAISINEVDISSIEINPNQPRTTFDDTALSELAESIRNYGIIQPITVRKIAEDRYQLISGERRFRASKLIGLTKIIAYIREVNDAEMLEFALIENIQREDLDAIEIAISYQRLIDECQITQEKLAEKVGKDRSTIANSIRLLKLPPEIQMGIKQNKITMGHARTLITIENDKQQIELYTEIVGKELSVRQTEELIKNFNGNKKQKKEQSKITDEQEVKISEIKQHYGNIVKVQRANNGKGKIIFSFRSDKEFEQLIELFLSKK